MQRRALLVMTGRTGETSMELESALRGLPDLERITLGPLSEEAMRRIVARCEEVPLHGGQARAAGLLCGVSGTADIVDASVAVTTAALARYNTTAVLTSDPADIGLLLNELGASATP